MSRVHKFRNQEKLYFVSFAKVNWIDIFIRKEYKEIVVESLKYCNREKGLELYAWCIMTSHVHLIIGICGDKMEDIIRDMKRHTSKTILATIKEYPVESRREWMIWMFERAPTCRDFQQESIIQIMSIINFGSSTTNQESC